MLLTQLSEVIHFRIYIWNNFFLIFGNNNKKKFSDTKILHNLRYYLHEISSKLSHFELHLIKIIHFLCIFVL